MAKAKNSNTISSLLLSRSALFSEPKKPVLTLSHAQEIVVNPVLKKIIEPIGKMNSLRQNVSNTKATEILSLLTKNLCTILGSGAQKNAATAQIRVDDSDKEVPSPNYSMK